MTGNIIGKDITSELKNSGMAVKDGVSDRKTIVEFLRADIDKKGFGFYKSKKIGDKVGMSAKEVGSNLKILAEELPKTEPSDIRITPHSYSKSTTWLVEKVGDSPKSAM